MHEQRKTQVHRGTRGLLAARGRRGWVRCSYSSAALAATHGRLHVWVTPRDGASDPILLTGVIADHGRATSIDKNGTVNQNGAYVKVVLTQGTFEVNKGSFGKAGHRVQPVFNMNTCSGQATWSGNITLFNGTGAYAGIRGTIRLTDSFAGIAPRYKSGAKKGQCNMNANPAPRARVPSADHGRRQRFALTPVAGQGQTPVPMAPSRVIHRGRLSRRSRSLAAGAARTRAGRARGCPGGTRASPRARPRPRPPPPAPRPAPPVSSRPASRCSAGSSEPSTGCGFSSAGSFRSSTCPGAGSS